MNNLVDYIAVYKNAISKQLCDNLVIDSENFSWKEFRWSTPDRYRKLALKEQKQPQIDTCEPLPPKYKLQLTPVIEKCVLEYKEKYVPLLDDIMGITPIKLNRYTTGLGLQQHIDHTHSIFDGNRKGIPTFSVVGLLNDDFEGGNFIFWDDYVVPLETGTVIVFPSNFLYAHRVDKVTKGFRLSLVSWVW